jgi:hypothetical protein
MGIHVPRAMVLLLNGGICPTNWQDGVTNHTRKKLET